MAAPTSVRLKIGRAEEHLETLAEEIRAYLNAEPYTLILNIQPGNQRLVLVEFHVREQPDDRIGLIIGDCVNNFRAALDHLTCRLVEKSGNVINRRTQFPILDKRTIQGGQPVRPTVPGGVTDYILAVIESLQPYQRGQDAPLHPLSILGHLSNIDKHSALHATAAYLADGECYLTFPTGEQFGGPAGKIVDHEAAIAAFQFPEDFDRALYPQVQVEAQGRAFVTIQNAGPWSDRPILMVLEEIGQFIRQSLLPALEPFLD